MLLTGIRLRRLPERIRAFVQFHHLPSIADVGPDRRRASRGLRTDSETARDEGTPVSSMESAILFISHRLCRENDETRRRKPPTNTRRAGVAKVTW